MQKHQGTNPSTFLSQLDKTITATEREIETKERFVKGLRLARENMASVILEGATRPRSRDSAPRAAVVKEILDAQASAVTVDIILTALEKRGIHTSRGNVSASLTYLKRKGFVKNPDRGKWASVTALQAVAA